MNLTKPQKLTLNEFEKIYYRLYTPLCLFANTYVNDLDISQDIVQDVFVKVWEDKLSFENQDKIDAFFYIAVKNKSLDFLKSKYSKDFKAYATEDLEILQSEAHFISEIAIIEASTTIENVLKLLPKRCAEAMRLSIKYYKNKEIAEKMNISVDTVKEYKKKSYKKLRVFFLIMQQIRDNKIFCVFQLKCFSSSSIAIFCSLTFPTRIESTKANNSCNILSFSAASGTLLCNGSIAKPLFFPLA